MVYLYWDFERNPELMKFDPLKRVELIQTLHKEMNIPIGYTAGFDNPYIEIESNDPIVNHPMFRDRMIPRAGFIQIVAVRHLTYQKDEYVKKIQEIAQRVLQ